MALGVSVVLAWSAIMILSMIPKKLSELEMVLLYFVNIIFELSIFTILHLNLGYIQVGSGVEKPFSDLVLRIVMIPTVLLISSNILLYSWKYLKWIIVAAMVLSFIMVQRLIEWLGIVSSPHWNAAYTVIMFSAYVIFSRMMTWWIRRLDAKEGY